MDNGLEIYENELSNFEGDYEMQEEFAYTGDGDDLVDFSGKDRSFLDEQHTGRIYVMTINNSTDETKDVVLIPSYASESRNPENIVKEGPILVDGTKNLLGHGSPSTIGELHSFLKNIPSNLIGMRIKSTNTDQLNQILSIKHHSPFKKLESREFFLGTYVSEKSFKDNMITIPTNNIVIGPETELSLPVVKGVTVITFFVGGILSTSSALKTKTARAYKNISIGFDNVNQRRLMK